MFKTFLAITLLLCTANFSSATPFGMNISAEDRTFLSIEKLDREIDDIALKLARHPERINKYTARIAEIKIALDKFQELPLPTNDDHMYWTLSTELRITLENFKNLTDIACLCSMLDTDLQSKESARIRPIQQTAPEFAMPNAAEVTHSAMVSPEKFFDLNSGKSSKEMPAVNTAPPGTAAKSSAAAALNTAGKKHLSSEVARMVREEYASRKRSSFKSSYSFAMLRSVLSSLLIIAGSLVITATLAYGGPLQDAVTSVTHSTMPLSPSFQFCCTILGTCVMLDLYDFLKKRTKKQLSSKGETI